MVLISVFQSSPAISPSLSFPLRSFLSPSCSLVQLSIYILVPLSSSLNPISYIFSLSSPSFALYLPSPSASPSSFSSALFPIPSFPYSIPRSSPFLNISFTPLPPVLLPSSLSSSHHSLHAWHHHTSQSPIYLANPIPLPQTDPPRRLNVYTD